MPLVNHKVYGSQDSPSLYIAHGVFGMLDNWHFIANELSKDFKVVTFDARNHGKSFHDEDASYQAMASDWANLIDYHGDKKPIIVGHSMGGKTAMLLTDLFPHLVEHLVVVDIAPKAYKPSHTRFIEAFKEIPFDRIESRKDADLAFSAYASDMAIRQFLLKNIEGRPEGGYRLKINIDALSNHYYDIIGSIEISHSHQTPTTFIKGNNSHYISDNDLALIHEFFPKAIIEPIENAGHWVHAEQPKEFLRVLRKSLLPSVL
jgi:esterase